MSIEIISVNEFISLLYKKLILYFVLSNTSSQTAFLSLCQDNKMYSFLVVETLSFKIINMDRVYSKILTASKKPLCTCHLEASI